MRAEGASFLGKGGRSGVCATGKYFGFELPKVPFPGFLSHSDRILVSSFLLGFRTPGTGYWTLHGVSLRERAQSLRTTTHF